VLPFLVLPMAVLLSRPVRAVVKVLIISVVAISCAIQLASVAYNFNLEFVQNPNHSIIPDDWVWDWSQSHLLKRFKNIAGHIAGERDFSSTPVVKEEPMLLKYNHSEQSVRTAYHINVFPFKAKGAAGSEQLFRPLLCFWVVLLTGFAAAALRLLRLCADGRAIDR
jgi:hypothetical protein